MNGCDDLSPERSAFRRVVDSLALRPRRMDLLFIIFSMPAILLSWKREHFEGDGFVLTRCIQMQTSMSETMCISYVFGIVS